MGKGWAPPVPMYEPHEVTAQYVSNSRANAELLSELQAKQKAYSCAGCGAPLFGLMNANCQYCKRPVGA